MTQIGSNDVDKILAGSAPIEKSFNGDNLIYSRDWLPTDLFYLLVWYDFLDTDTVSVDGSNGLTDILDKSGNDYHGSQNDAEKRPVYTDNNKVVFSGNEYIDMKPTVPGLVRATSVFNCFTLCQFSSTAENQYIAAFSIATATAVRFGLSSTSGAFSTTGRRQDIDAFTAVSGSAIDTNLHLFHGQHDHTVGTATVWKDGVQDAYDPAFNGIGTTYNSDSAYVGLGSLNETSSGYFYNGNLYEVVIANAMTKKERQKLEGWCAHYTNNTSLLNVNHRYKSNKPKKYEPCILDDYDDILVAAGLERMRSNYNGYCIRVQRASDSQEQDIGFSGDEIDRVALETFCSGTNGVITRIYLQNMPSLYFTPDSDPPVIVESGIMVTDPDGNPAAKMVDKAVDMEYTPGLPGDSYSVYVDYTVIDSTDDGRAYTHGWNGGNNKGFYIGNDGSGNFSQYWGGTSYSEAGVISDNTRYQIAVVVDGTPSFKTYNETTKWFDVWSGARELNDDWLMIGTQWGAEVPNCNMYFRKLAILNHAINETELSQLTSFS